MATLEELHVQVYENSPEVTPLKRHPLVPQLLAYTALEETLRGVTPDNIILSEN